MNETTEASSSAWWQRVKAEPALFEAWLADQYRGEATAAIRIEVLRDAFTAPGSRGHRVLSVIATQERKHAAWVGELLRARGLCTEVGSKVDRYWQKTIPLVSDLETGAAVGAHAERMRLERIEVIAGDEDAPRDVREVFRRILPEERFHERAFRSLATEASLRRTEGAHELGRLALGLSA